MTTEHDFYRELGHVPELPPSLYGSVRTKIRRQSFFSRALMAAAAIIIVAAGTAGMLSSHKRTDLSVSPEAVAELQTVHNYLTGRDLDNAYESYVLYEEDCQEQLY